MAGKIGVAVLAAALLAGGQAWSAPSHAGPPERQAPPPPPPSEPPVSPPEGPPVRRIPSPGGEVVLTGQRDETSWSELKFAPLRRAGDVVYLSGAVMGPRPGEGHDVAAFKAQARRAFSYLQAALQAEGLTFADVAMMQTFHVWSGPNFDGGKAEQFEAFAQVKDEFLKAPYPAWTAVGVTELLPGAGVVEIQLTAHVPPPPAPPPPVAKPPKRPAPKPAPKPHAQTPPSEPREPGH